MATRKVVIAAAGIIAIIVIAGAVAVAYPMLANSKPATTPGTSFISTGVVGSSIGGTWQKTFYVAGGTHDPAAFYQATGSTLGNITVSPYLSGNVAGSVIGYDEPATGANLTSLFVYFPNSTAAANAYANITRAVDQNSSIQVSSGTVAGADYTYVNLTAGLKVTQAIYGHSGNYLVAFIYVSTTAVSEKGMVTLLGDQFKVLNSSPTPPYPAHLVTSGQANSALSISADSYTFAVANITNASSLLGSLGESSLFGNATYGGSFQTELLGNITEIGLAAFVDTAKNVTAVSAYATFKTSTMPTTVWEDLSLEMSSSTSGYASSYHQGTVNGKQYFFINTSENPFTHTYTSAIFCLDGNSLLIQFATASSVYGYQVMSGLTSSQISDL